MLSGFVERGEPGAKFQCAIEGPVDPVFRIEQQAHNLSQLLGCWGRIEAGGLGGPPSTSWVSLANSVRFAIRNQQAARKELFQPIEPTAECRLCFPQRRSAPSGSAGALPFSSLLLPLGFLPFSLPLAESSATHRRISDGRRHRKQNARNCA